MTRFNRMGQTPYTELRTFPLAAGGHFTMDMKRAGYAAKTFFDFKTVIPCHYKTFPILEQSAEALVDALPGVDVIEPQVMVPIKL